MASLFPTVAVEAQFGGAIGVYAKTVLGDSPVGYWRLGEASGAGVATDLSGAGRHGAYAGGFTVGQAGALSHPDTATTFDGSTGVVTVPSAALPISGTVAYSMECWVKFNARPVGDDVFIGRHEELGGLRNGAFIYARRDGGGAGLDVLIAERDAANTLYAASAAGVVTIVVGDWYYVVVTYDGTTERLYVNGAFVDDVASAGTVAALTAPAYAAGWADIGNHTNAVIDEAAFYNVALSAAQITAHYAARLIGAWTDLRAANDVDRAAGLEITHGIDGSSPLDRVASTGTASFALRNSTLNSGGVLGYYSPNHASVRFGWDLGIGCRVRITDPATLTVHTRFVGRVDRIDPVPGRYRDRLVEVTAVDWLEEAARWTLTAAVGEQVEQDWSAILADLLAQMPHQPTATSLAPGTETYPYALDTSPSSEQKALSEFLKLANSEFGLIFIKADGTLRAEDRHVRMTTTASVWTLADTDFHDLEVPSAREDLINTVRVTTHPKVVDTAATHVVYRQANVIPFAAGQSKTLLGPFRDEDTGEPIGATAIQALVAGTDYVANTLADGSGSTVTSSFLVTVVTGASGAAFVVTNGTGAAAYLTTLQLRGKRILDHGTTQHEATDATSISDHGEHVVDFDMPYQASDDVGQGAADFILAKFKDPLAQARRIRVLGITSSLLTQILTRDVSDRITLSETVTGVNAAFYINGMTLRVLASGYVEAEYTLTPAQDPFSGLYFLLDMSALDGAAVLAPF